MGLDNPDTLYFHAYLRDDAEYVVTGTRGTTADLSFQVLKGDYTPVEVPDSLSAFDDRAIEIGRRRRDSSSGSGPARPAPATSRSARARPCSLVREVYSDWAAERRGTIRIHRADRDGLRAAAVAGHRDRGEALRGGGQAPAVPAADVPRLPRVVLPERAGQHADPAARARPAAWPPSSPRRATTTSPTTRR